MFKPRQPSRPLLQHFPHWFLLSASAGFVNAGAFLGVGTFATHISGFATLFGVHAAQGDFHSAWIALFVPAFFLLGAFLGGYWSDVRLSAHKAPRYDWIMGLACLLLLTASLLGDLELGTAFGQDLSLHGHPILLSLLCFSSGLQNAALSTASGQSVRIGHVTGLTTDLGRGLAKLVFEKSAGEMSLSALRLGSIAFFMAGSLLGTLCFMRLGFHAFAIPAVVCAYATYQGHRAKAFYRRTPTRERRR